jgi:hypothetical protein
MDSVRAWKAGAVIAVSTAIFFRDRLACRFPTMCGFF